MFRIIAAAALMASAAVAQDDLSVTIYNADAALVSDTRAIEFGRGEQTVALPNVSSMIVAPSVGFDADGIAIVEQNYDFDLLSPQALMEKSVGETVLLVSVNPATGRETRRRATILAVNGGVVIEAEGRIEVLRDDGLPTRVIFERVPPNLRAEPTLSVTVDSARAGRRPARLTYLTGGLSWRADYVADFDEAAGTLDLQGWATIENRTETTFEAASLKLVAGDVATSGNDYSRRGRQRGRPGVREAGMQTGSRERVGDYYLYPLDGRSTVASNQVKQIGIVSADGLPAAKRYEYRMGGFSSSDEAQNVEVRIALDTARGAGGDALPAGTVRVYQCDASGQSLFVGEDRLGHTPAGSELSIKTGEAFDVTAQPRVVRRAEVSRYVTDTQVEVTLRNASPDDVEVAVRQDVPTYRGEVTVRQENAPSERLDADSLEWTVPVPANDEAKLTYTLRVDERVDAIRVIPGR